MAVGAAAIPVFGFASVSQAEVLNSCLIYCHGTPPRDGVRRGNLHFNSQSSAFVGSHSTHLPQQAAPANCNVCHVPVAPTNYGHQNGSIQMANSLKGYSSAKVRAKYDKGVFFNQTSIPNLASATCSNVSCHFETKTPLWASTPFSAPANCNACHGAPPAGTAAAQGLAGSHARHDAYFTGANNCQKCHPVYSAFTHATSAGRPLRVQGYLRDPLNTLEATGTYNGAGSNYFPSQNGAQVFGSCSNLYCHSTGNPSVAAANLPTTYGGSAFASVSWGSGPQACNSCHGRSTTNGMPDYVSAGTPGSATANSHAKHVQVNNISCNECHERTTKDNVSIRNVFPSAHVNKTADVFFNLSGANKAASFSASTGTCNNVFCHGGTGSTAVWGASLNCQDCHGNGASASVADFGASFWNNGVMSKFQMTGTGSWADTGHGRPTASGNYPGSNNPPANFAGISNYCEWCHDSTIGHNVSGNPFRLRNWTDATWGKNGVCMLCHLTGSAGVTAGGVLKNGAAKVSSYHYGAKHSTALSGGQYCWDCHDPHGTGTTNQYMIRSLPALASDATTGAPTSQATTAAVFSLSATPTGTDFAKSAAPFNGVCNVCHTTTSHYTTTSGDSHNSGTACTSCHSHSETTATTGFTPVGGGESSGGSDCSGCHTDLTGYLEGTASYHHYLSNTTPTAGTIAQPALLGANTSTNRNCLMCHVDHSIFRPDIDTTNGGRGRNLRADISTAPAAATAATFSNTDFINSGNGGLCLSCHITSQTTLGYTQPDGSTAKPAIPYAGTAATQVAAFNGSAHQYTVNSTFSGTLTNTFAANCVKCHNDTLSPKSSMSAQTSTYKFGLHQSTLRSMNAPLGTPSPSDPLEERFCYNCHSQLANAKGKPANGNDYYAAKAMGSSAEDTFNAFSSATRVYRHNIAKYTGQHKANETQADISANKHVGCTDCHNPHVTAFGNHSSSQPATARGLRANTIANVINGASGSTPTYAATNWTAASSFAFGQATNEAQVCYKCHSKANTGWFGNMTSATPMGGKYKTWTDLALEFNPNNASRHPIGTALATASRLTTAKLTGGWKPGDVMTCSDCHATDSTASKGPHGSSVKWMLAGVNKAWPYTTAAQNGTNSGTLFRIGNYNTGAGTVNGLFCLNCHQVTASNPFHSANGIASGEHANNATVTSCVSCHIRVPHGGKVTRLRLTTKAPVRYRADGATTTPAFAAWPAPGSSVGGNWTTGACTHHSGGTESW
jgi:predicted CxxxxCH...CXXCH cytochrome family protein